MYIRANRLFAQRKSSRYDAIKINEQCDRTRYLILRRINDCLFQPIFRHSRYRSTLEFHEFRKKYENTQQSRLLSRKVTRNA